MPTEDHQDLRPFAFLRRSVRGAIGALATGAVLVACGTEAPRRPNARAGPSIGPDAEPLAENLLDVTPDNQVATYRNANRLPLATRVVHADPDRATPLPRNKTSLNGLRYTYNGTQSTIDEYVTENRVTGLLVLKDGRIAYEQYGMGNVETTLWTNFSIAKSFTATLTGIALEDGAIGSLDDSVEKYVPELVESAYKDNTIRQLLQMRSGIKWDEDHYFGTGNSDIARFSQGMYYNQPNAVMNLVRTRPRAAAPGSVFYYSTADAYILGAAVIGATGKPMSDYLSERIWRPFGMESDGYWILDAEGGREMGGNGISATLRDHGRFGQFILGGGDGVLPKGWRDEAGKPESPLTDYGRVSSGSRVGYGYMWRAIPAGMAGASGLAPTFYAGGTGGQKLYINPAERVVAVLFAAWDENNLDDYRNKRDKFWAVIDAAVKALR
ncbi:serine hydrolase domain-containing protein [Nocardia sp. NPDC059239]|uniref:serine hydrolase domain-containing protein n=1 Tax=Nocardia sp. NPDC059239 TaxID=3346785 RepID=UPI0036B7CA94